VTEPTPPNPLVVDVDDVARQLKLDTPVDSDTAETLRQAILDAQADVEAYLNRPIVPVLQTARNLWPSITGWQIDDDVISIVSATPETYPDGGTATGLFTVTYYAGLDARNDPTLRPIVRYVTAAAKNDAAVVDIWREQVRPRGAMTSISTDGQSASFAAPTLGGGGEAGSGSPGALPKIDALYPWKRGAVFQRRTPGSGLGWAYSDIQYRGGGQWWA
jgi:hypothetical protein